MEDEVEESDPLWLWRLAIMLEWNCWIFTLVPDLMNLSIRVIQRKHFQGPYSVVSGESQ